MNVEDAGADLQPPNYINAFSSRYERRQRNRKTNPTPNSKPRNPRTSPPWSKKSQRTRVSDMAEGTPKAAPEQLRVSESRILYTLNMIREPVVEYQEARGIPRTEDITFVTLVTSLCSQSYTAAITILVMLWNLMPLVDGFVYFIRFLLDKLIDILQTQDTKDRAIKTAIFVGELTVIMFLIFMIVGLIFMPVYVLMVRLFSKVFSMVVW